MKRLDSLTPEQEALMSVISQKWIDRAMSGEFDEQAIATGVEWLYTDLLKSNKKPAIFFADCPYSAISLINLIKNNKKASVRASVGDSVGDSVRDSVWASVGDSVRASVRDSVGASVGASVWDSVRDSVREIWNDRCRYIDYSDYAFTAWGEFFDTIGLDVVKNHETFQKFKPIIFGNPFMSWFYEGIAVIVRPPVLIKKDTDGRLHDINGAAIQFRNDTKLFFVHGRAMPEKLFREEFNIDDFMKEENEDVRAAMYEIAESKSGGFAKLSGAEIVSTETIVHGGGYTETIYLYKTKNTFKGTMDALTGKTDVQLAWLKLTCPSTGQQYMIPSFPSFKTASEAARHHRPQGIPTDLPYLWQSAS